MKKYEIRYYLDKDNYVTRHVDDEGDRGANNILEAYTEGDTQTFLNGREQLCRVNMNNVFYTKIFESRR